MREYVIKHQVRANRNRVRDGRCGLTRSEHEPPEQYLSEGAWGQRVVNQAGRRAERTDTYSMTIQRFDP